MSHTDVDVLTTISVLGVILALALFIRWVYWERRLREQSEDAIVRPDVHVD